MINCIIIEDIAMAAESLSLLLERVAPDEFEVHWAQYSEDAVALIDYLKPDLLFMDIQLGAGDGFDVLERSKGKFGKVIFTTGGAENAIRAFKYSAVDYLLKPVGMQELSEAIERYKKQAAPVPYSTGLAMDTNMLTDLKEVLLEAKAQKSGMLFISDAGVYKNIEIDNICYLMAQRSYSNIICRDNRYTSSRNLNHYQNELAGYSHFKKIHKSYIVNCKLIKQIKKGLQSTVELVDGSVLPVSENEKKALFDYLNL